MLAIIALMRDWLIYAGSDELFDEYCGYTARNVVVAIDDMYPGGCTGWLMTAWEHGGMPRSFAGG